MPFNGSGTFTRVHDWTSERDAGNDIDASKMDAEDDGFASGLTQAITKNGTTTITANLPMSGHKHTGVAAASARTDYARASDVQDNSLCHLGSVSGVDTITASTTPALSAYAAGQRFSFVSAGANTGAVTLNINGAGAKAITKNGTTALEADDIASGEVVNVTYDGTQFQTTVANDAVEVPTGGYLPIGSVVDYAGTSAPSGYLFSFGQTLDSVANTEYADLYAAIGTTYGGTGADDFDLPDLRGYVVAGKDNMGGSAASRLTSPVSGSTLGGSGGSQNHTLTEAELAAHDHPYARTDLAGSAGMSTGGSANVSSISQVTVNSSSAGGNTAHNNTQPTFVLNKIMRYA